MVRRFGIRIALLQDAYRKPIKKRSETRIYFQRNRKKVLTLKIVCGKMVSTIGLLEMPTGTIRSFEFDCVARLLAIAPLAWHPRTFSRLR